MTKPVQTVREYCGGLARSRLLPGEEVNRLYAAWRVASAGQEADVEGFRRFLVRNRHLTEYQAALIQHGHTEGFILAGHVILDRLAQSYCFRAVHGATGQRVLLAVLPPEQGSDPQRVAAFLQLIRRRAGLNHPCIPRIFPLRSSSGLVVTAMELTEGPTVNDLLERRGSLPTQEAVRLVHQLLSGLQHAHERGIVHGQIQPDSLLLCGNDHASMHTSTLTSTLKILDLGVRRDFFEHSGTSRATHLRPEFAAPETTMTPSEDIYAAGRVLLRMLAQQPSGVRPRGSSQKMNGSSHAIHALPLPLQEVLARMTSAEVSERYATAAAAAAALAPFLPPNCQPPEPAVFDPGYLRWIKDGQQTPRPSRHGPVSSAKIVTGSLPAERRGIGLAAAVGAGVASRPSTAPPVALKPPSAAPRSIVPATADPPSSSSDIDVELMPVEELPAPVVAQPPTRPLWELDRRDFIMLGFGSCGVIAAVGIGIFAAKFNSDKIRRGPEE